KFQAWGKSIAAIGAGVAAMGAGLTAPFAYGLSVFAEVGSTITSAARMTGMSFTEVQDAAAGMRVGMEDLPGATRKMSDFMLSAAHGSHEAQQALGELGVTFDELQGMSQYERMLRF